MNLSVLMWINLWRVLCFSYQFVVKDDGDYSIHSVDPDVLVDWDAIELIVCVFVNLIHVYYK